MSQICQICPRHCSLEEGQTGFCRARINKNDQISCINYGRLTAMNLDPIEKKPLRRFFPGKSILSVGSYGCNLRCPFCQNSDISMAGANTATKYVSPEELVDNALRLVPADNIGIAFTYNEPLVGYEYVRDCARLAKDSGLKTVAVTNGTICRKPLLDILPYIDAMNIDLKGFTQRFYDMIGGSLETVKQSISLAAGQCHVEVTTLIIPGENDSESEMEELSGWLAGVDPNIPLHISRFFPQWQMRNKEPTPVKTVYQLRDVAKRRLRYVYTGNC